VTSSGSGASAPFRPDRVHPSVDALLAHATERGPWAKHPDSLSGSPFEYVVIDGVRHVVKHIGVDLDWIMRALGDGQDGAPPWALVMWRSGLLDALPAEIDHTIVGMAWDANQLAVLMRDVSDTFLPTDRPIPLDRHHRFLDHMARMHAAFWGFDDRYGLMPAASRYTGLTPAMSAREAAAGNVTGVPAAVPGGWDALRAAAPAAYELALGLATDPTPLVEALDETPATLIHGDWKAGNLGSHPDGRTVLVDWGWPGRAGPCVDLGWYLAVNCDLLPESKEDAAAHLRRCLERHGVATGGWWRRQLDLALVGSFVQLGWSKTHDRAELAWWVERVVPVARELLR
jgi:hypothetical protein